MKDEIKEILDSIQEHLKEKEEDFKKGAVDSTVYYLYCDDARTLLDYITNLQEENKRLKEIVENLTTMTVCGDKKQIKNTAQYKLDIYKSRNEKAIEYIKEHSCIATNKEYKPTQFEYCCNADLLNILKGDSNEINNTR